jgi:uroporphyrinogen decarboxylase
MSGPLQPLSRDDVKRAVEFHTPSRPVFYSNQWIHEDARKLHGQKLDDLFARFPIDVIDTSYDHPSHDGRNYSWGHESLLFKKAARTSKGLENGQGWISNPEDYVVFVENMPNPNQPGTFDEVKRVRDENPDRYVLGSWWGGFFEMSWTIRGMEDWLMDLYECPDKVHLWEQALADYQCALVERFAEAGVDGIWTTDDLGTQSRLMMRPAHFREFLKPRYRQVIEAGHSHGMHFWLHSCGNITEIMPDFVEIGLDVIHPIQPHAMDAEAIVKEFGGQIGMIGAIDVQYLLPSGTPDEVREGIRRRLDTFYRQDGGTFLGVANSIMPETPYENFEAYVDAMIEYAGHKTRD